MASAQMLKNLKEAERLSYYFCEKKLTTFVKNAWDVLEPVTPLQWNWHIDYVCEHLEAVKAGQIQKLIINIRPRSIKSNMATVCFPVWDWVDVPHDRFLFGSFADDLATSHSVKRRNLINSPWFQKGFGNRFKLSSDTDTKSYFSNEKTGFMKSLGMRGAVTGQGGEYIIIDDPHNPKGAESKVQREETLDNWDMMWSSRLNDRRTGKIIVIMQRLHENDLTGHILSKNLGYKHIKIPSIATHREVLYFPMSGREFVREQGDLMHPERDGPEQIDEEKKTLGPYGFSGQHQQDPVPASGGTFTSDMFDYVPVPKPEDFDYQFIMADTAYEEKKENDFTVFTAFGVKDKELYIIDVWRKQIQAAKVEALIIPFIKRFSDYGFRGCYIEPKGHGIYLNQALPGKGIMIPSEERRLDFYKDRTKGKVERANNAVPWLANRRVHINETILDKEELLAECLKFPKAAHDDFVDTVVDGIKFVFSRKLSILDVL